MSKRIVRRLSVLLAATAIFAIATTPAASAQVSDPSRVEAANRPDRSTRPAFISMEYVAATSKAAKDMHGSEPSLYRGKYFYADQEAFRKCVADREGSFTYTVRGGGGNNYYGTYQFSRAFQNGIPYMMAKESKRTKDGLRAEALKLRSKPINRWNRYWQDRAFYSVLNYNGKWSGKHHWAGGRWHC